MTPPLAFDILRRALVFDPAMSLPLVLARLEDGSAQIFEGRQSLLVTEIRDFFDGRECYVALGGGEMRELMDDLRPRVEAFAIANGCNWIEVASKAGIRRLLRNHGYTDHATDKDGRVTLRKML